MLKKLWKNTGFLRVENWQLYGFLVAIPGADRVTIQYRRRMTTKNLPYGQVPTRPHKDLKKESKINN